MILTRRHVCAAAGGRLVGAALAACRAERTTPPPPPKTVFIIVDGIPADVLEQTPTPAIDAIAAAGGYTRAYVGGADIDAVVASEAARHLREHGHRERTIWIAANSPHLNAHFRETPAIVDILPSIAAHMRFTVPEEVRRQFDGRSFIDRPEEHTVSSSKGRRQGTFAADGTEPDVSEGARGDRGV